MTDREETERLIQKLLRKRKDKFEALSWLKERDTKSVQYLAEYPPEASIKVIKEIYRSGAKEVWAVQFDRNLQYESINTLIITLPEDPTKRGTVFRWAHNQAEQEGFDPDVDYGQSHLYV